MFSRFDSNLKKSKTTEDVKIADQRLHRADSTTELAQTQNIEMANENQNYNEMIVYIEQHYMNSYNTTPRDRQEIFAHLPAWKELNAMREHRTGLRSTITLMEESIVMYFVVVTRGWKIALKTKEESLYERMGVLHAAEPPQQLQIINNYSSQRNKFSYKQKNTGRQHKK